LGLWIIADCGWFSILKEKEKIKQILALLAAPAALVMWMVYLHFHCGDALAFSHTQSAWGHKYTWPWKTLIFDGAWYKEVISWYAIALVLMVILLLRRARLGEQLFVGINVMFPLMTGLIASYYRYFSAIPQVFIRLFAAIESRWKLAVVICFIINTLLYYVWVSVLSHEAWLTY
jgi:hypothetical protein